MIIIIVSNINNKIIIIIISVIQSFAWYNLLTNLNYKYIRKITMYILKKNT